MCVPRSTITKRGSVTLAALLTALTFISAPAYAGHDDYVSAQYVEQVVYRHPNGAGEFVQVSTDRWSEYNPDGTFSFEERFRDSGAIWLYDATRNTWIVLDIAAGMIRVSQGGKPLGDLYSIVDQWGQHLHQAERYLASGRATESTGGNAGWALNQVSYRHRFGPGKFVQIGPTQWIERNPDGQFWFEESARFGDGVELYDHMRDVRMLIDLRRQYVLRSQQGSQYQDVYAISGYDEAASSRTTYARSYPANSGRNAGRRVRQAGY